jgi:hypothetical protein
MGNRSPGRSNMNSGEGLVMAEDILNNPKIIPDLFEVQGLRGDRCIGDQASYGLKEWYGIDIDDKATRDKLTKALDEAGLSHYYANEEHRVEMGWKATSLYAYDKGRLQELLDQNRDMLVKAEWPTTSDRFVHYLSYVTAPANTEIFDFIARCHGDNQNPGLRKSSYTAMTAAEIEQQRVRVEHERKRFKELHPDFFKDDEPPSVSNNSSTPPVRSSGNSSSSEARETNLYKLLAERQGRENIDGNMFSQLYSFGHPNFAAKTKDGFKMELGSGSSIEWSSVQKRGKPQESIKGSKADFSLFEASAIVTMARVHGWQSINVQGSKEHKEMLWLATQRQALHERDMQLSGAMPEGTLPHVTNFKPSEDSAIYKQWLEEKAGWEKAHGGEKFDNTPAPKADSAGSAQTPAIKEAKTPRDKILRAFGQKLRTQFTKHAARKPAVAPERDTAPVKPAGTRSRFHRRPDGKQKPGA